MGSKTSSNYDHLTTNPLLFIAFFTTLSLVSFSSSSGSNSCKNEERTALLQFKNHFSMNQSSCEDRYSGLIFWDNSSKDCCSWVGVECDNITGHIIGLDLYQSCLYGTFPSNNSLLNLVHLQELEISGNNFNNSPISNFFGNFQSFGLKQLKKLDLSDNNLRGPIPSSLFNLTKLEKLDLSGNYFSGVLSDSIEKLKSLQSLDLSDCHISGTIPLSLSNLRNLSDLRLGGNYFYGPIPASLGNLTQLTNLNLSNNELKENIPFSILNLTKLDKLDLSKNSLSGQLPYMFSSLSNNISYLDLSENNLVGTIDLEMFKNLRNLGVLSLSSSGLSVTISNSIIFSALPVIFYLDLSLCNISTNNLTYFSAPENFRYLDLSSNNIGNKLNPSICNLSSLGYLDLSHNQLTGEIPICFGKSTTNLQVLYLRNNNFRGPIPLDIGFANYLQYLDLSENGFQGVVARSLTNCTYLEVLNLGDNMLMDSFPFWLGNLPSLKVLVLRENKFKGTIKGQLPRGFANLHIIDMSYNDLTGNLPSIYFENLNAMSIVEKGTPNLGYMQIANRFYSVVIMNKGLPLNYEKILVTLKVINFSHNKFYGDIPLSIGRLKGVQVLNLSQNSLTGNVPISLGNLVNLESLDLSSNNLYGEIPREMSNLKFLSFFNVSKNNFSGVIPRGGQLNTFSNASYLGNPNLCGFPLSKLCRITNSPNIVLRKKHRFEFKIDDFGWEVVLIGYICGTILGMMIGCCVFRGKEEWILHKLHVILF